MRGDCPDCEATRLDLRVDGELHAALCFRCKGLWFDADDAARAVTAEVKSLRVNARFANGRCRQGHPAPRDAERCPTCETAISTCPSCDAALAQVRHGKHAIDLCPSCGGLWLQPGAA